jgi:hypothetical protein
MSDVDDSGTGTGTGTGTDAARNAISAWVSSNNAVEETGAEGGGGATAKDGSKNAAEVADPGLGPSEAGGAEVVEGVWADHGYGFTEFGVPLDAEGFPSLDVLFGRPRPAEEAVAGEAEAGGGDGSGGGGGGVGEEPDNDAWKRLLAWKPNGDLDLAKSIAGFPEHESEAADLLVEWHWFEMFSVVDLGRSRLFRRWEGRIWAEDDQDVAVFGWLRHLWHQMAQALRKMRRAAEVEAEGARDRSKARGESDKSQEAAYKQTLSAWTAKLKEAEGLFKRMGTDAGRSAVANLASKVGDIVRRDDDFDAVAEFMVLRNGVLDFSALVDAKLSGAAGLPEFELLAHSSARMVTMLAGGVDWDSGAGVGPIFSKYVADVLPVEAVRWHLQKILGSSLLGDPKSKLMVNLIGEKDSGKSVLLDVLHGVGGDYVTWAESELFLAPKGGRGGGAGGGAENASPGCTGCGRPSWC